ncbi:DUF2569 family protein [Acidovorax sp. sic0104]|uniref:DUF2569 family protein n=1 Tax=Acidovorax sp. sic0104 TaxID=2854784 RepID=UPI001C44CAEA|nr:DUF2569 family protein [Acidovorax sp. sic0104]MBV7539463.1 DUF2569 family protein [Acidovorax sp. sic0104]
MAPSSAWIEVSQEEARKHPLYGVRGWLLLFAVGMLLAAVKSLGDAGSMAKDAGLTLSQMFELGIPLVRFYKTALGAQVLQTTVVLWMMLAKPAAFRVMTSWILIIGFPATAVVQLVLAPFDGNTATLSEMSILWAISCATSVTYLNLSRRVRVTFEHRIRSDDAMMAVVAAPPSALTREQREVPSAQAPARQHVHPAIHSSAASETVTDEDHWAQALAEFDGPGRRPGLWARSFVQAQGDEIKAKVFYLGARVDELARTRCKLAEGDGPANANTSASATATSSAPQQKATCPNCSKPLMLTDQECSHCKAIFGPGATWGPIPLATS